MFAQVLTVTGATFALQTNFSSTCTVSTPFLRLSNFSRPAHLHSRHFTTSKFRNVCIIINTFLLQIICEAIRSDGIFNDLSSSPKIFLLLLVVEYKFYLRKALTFDVFLYFGNVVDLIVGNCDITGWGTNKRSS